MDLNMAVSYGDNDPLASLDLVVLKVGNFGVRGVRGISRPSL